MRNSKAAKRRTGGWVAACVALAAALAFTAVFAQEGAEQEKETLPDSGAVKPDTKIIRSRIPYPPPAPRKPAYIEIPRVADTEVIFLHVLAETDMELHDGGFRSAKGEAKAEEAALEIMGVLKRHGAGRVERAVDAERSAELRAYRVDVKGLTEERRFECLKELHGNRAAWKAEFPSLSENLPRKREHLEWGRVKYDEEAKHTDLIQVKFLDGSKVRLREGKLVTLSESEDERKEVEEVSVVLVEYGVKSINRVHEREYGEVSYVENLRKKTGRKIPDTNLWFDLDTGDMGERERLRLFRALSESTLIEAMDFEYIEVDYSNLDPRIIRFLGLRQTHRKKLRPYVPYGRKRYYLELPHDAHTSRISLKFIQPSKVRLREGRFVSLGGPPEEQEKLEAVNALFERFGVVSIRRSTRVLSEEEIEREKEESLKLRGEEAYDRNLSYKVDMEHLSEEERLAFINKLNALELVESAYFAPVVVLHSGPLIRGLELILTTHDWTFTHNYCALTAL